MKAHYGCLLLGWAQQFGSTLAAPPMSEVPLQMPQQASNGFPMPWSYGMLSYPMGNASWPYPPVAYPYNPYWALPVGFDQPSGYHSPPLPGGVNNPQSFPFPSPVSAFPTVTLTGHESTPTAYQTPSTSAETSEPASTERSTSLGPRTSTSNEETVTSSSSRTSEGRLNETTVTDDNLLDLLEKLRVAESKISTEIVSTEMPSSAASDLSGTTSPETENSSSKEIDSTETSSSAASDGTTLPETENPSSTDSLAHSSMLAATATTQEDTTTRNEMESVLRIGETAMLETANSTNQGNETGTTSQSGTIIPGRYRGTGLASTDSPGSTEASVKSATDTGTSTTSMSDSMTTSAGSITMEATDENVDLLTSTVGETSSSGNSTTSATSRTDEGEEEDDSGEYETQDNATVPLSTRITDERVTPLVSLLLENATTAEPSKREGESQQQIDEHANETIVRLRKPTRKIVILLPTE